MKAPRTPRALRGPLRKRKSHLWKRAKHDWYVEPLWCALRLFHVEAFEGGVCDPCCGLGRTVQAAALLGIRARGTDVVDRGGTTHPPEDFLRSKVKRRNFVFNPPFKLAAAFVAHALVLSEGKVAVLLPASWHQAEGRTEWLAGLPLARVWFLAPRPSMPPGQMVRKQEIEFAARRPLAERRRRGKAGNGTTDYAWYVFEHGHVGPWTGHTLTRTPRIAPVSRETLPLSASSAP